MKFNQKNYSLVKKIKSEKLGVDVFCFIHKSTKQTHIHFNPIDPTNIELTFFIDFPTPPINNSGIPHILEHCVLSGSDKYPDPAIFVKIKNSSLSQFLGATTESVETSYMASTQSKPDFDNLFDVMLDSVFHPKLTDDTFTQEAWRYSLESVDSPLKYSGIVYNEMKGALQNNRNKIFNDIKSHLFKSTPYEFEYNGIPSSIPNCTNLDVKQFHKTYYHPSKCTIMSYGFIDLIKFQDSIHDSIKDIMPLNSEKGKYFIPEKNDEVVTNHQKITTYYQSDGDTNRVIKNYMASTTSDILNNYRLKVLSRYLLADKSSKLSKLLESHGLGTLDIFNGIYNFANQGLFTIGLSNIKPGDENKVLDLIDSSLKLISSSPQNNKKLRAIIDDIELKQLDKMWPGFPSSVLLFFSTQMDLRQSGNLSKALDIDNIFKTLKKEIEQPDFISSLILKELLGSKRTLELIAIPDPQYLQKINIKEEESLETIKSRLNPRQLQSIIDSCAKVSVPESAFLTDIPKIKSTDIPLSINSIPTVIVKALNGNVNFDLFEYNSGVNYTKLLFKMPLLTPSEVNLLPIYQELLNNLFSSHNASSGFSLIKKSQQSKTDPFIFDFIINFKSLEENLSKEIDTLIPKIINPSFGSLESIKKVLISMKDMQLESTQNFAQTATNELSNFNYSKESQINSKLSGLGKYEEVSRLLSILDSSEEITKKDEYQSLTKSLCLMHKKIVNNLYNAVAVGSAVSHATIQIKISESFINKPKMGKNEIFDFVGYKELPLTKNKKMAITSSTNVNSNSVSYKISLNITDPNYAVLKVLSKFVTTNFLFPEVRVKSGAYGINIEYDGTNFVLSSTRDPNCYKTIDTFLKAPDFMRSLKLLDRKDNLDSAIISTINQIEVKDNPITSRFNQHEAYKSGISINIKNTLRQNILNCTIDDLKRAITTYFQSSPYIASTFCHENESKSLVDKEFEIISLDKILNLQHKTSHCFNSEKVLNAKI